jgi:hypothetical protein
LRLICKIAYSDGARMNSKRHSGSLGNYGNSFAAFPANGFVLPQSVRRCPDFRWGERPREPRSPGFGNDSPESENRRPVFKSHSPEFETASPVLANGSPGFGSRSPDFQDGSPGLAGRSPEFFRLSPVFKAFPRFGEAFPRFILASRHFWNLLAHSNLCYFQ